jgi:F-type H+-transporting ATPase subunit delta
MNQPEQVRHKTVLDDDARQVARVYAEAAYKAAEAAAQADELLAELDAVVNGVFRRNPGLEVFLASPAVGRDRKADALRRAFDGRASKTLLNFLLVLNSHDRLGAVRIILDEYRRLHERRHHRFHVWVRSAVPLTDPERQRLVEDLRGVTQREPILEESVDADLLGGLVIRVGDWVYDTSVRTRLVNIRNELIERSSHDIAGQRDRFRS